MIEPLTYHYLPEVVHRVGMLECEGLLSDLYLDDKKVGRFEILPPEEYGSMYDDQKLVSVGALAHMWLNNGEYDKQISEGKIFKGVVVKAYSDTIVSASILMGDKNA